MSYRLSCSAYPTRHRAHTGARRRDKKPDPKEQVKEWKKQMRGEERKLDRQITSELRAKLPPRQVAVYLDDPFSAIARNKKRGDKGEAVDQASR